VVNIINAHDDFLVGHIEPNTEVDILISLGDLYDVTLQKDVDVYAPVLYLDVFEIHPHPSPRIAATPPQMSASHVVHGLRRCGQRDTI
jgi:hypothetical protein